MSRGSPFLFVVAGAMSAKFSCSGCIFCPAQLSLLSLLLLLTSHLMWEYSVVRWCSQYLRICLSQYARSNLYRTQKRPRCATATQAHKPPRMRTEPHPQIRLSIHLSVRLSIRPPAQLHARTHGGTRCHHVTMLLACHHVTTHVECGGTRSAILLPSASTIRNSCSLPSA